MITLTEIWAVLASGCLFLALEIIWFSSTFIKRKVADFDSRLGILRLTNRLFFYCVLSLLLLKGLEIIKEISSIYVLVATVVIVVWLSLDKLEIKGLKLFDELAFTALSTSVVLSVLYWWPW